MTDTKEKILITALHLFARDGFDAVSVSTISGELGMTKGALYKHYKNKRDIFDSIVERMFEIDAERSKQYQVPEEQDCKQSVSWDSVRRFTLAQYIFWTQDDFARNFRKMLSLEQYRDEEMAQLYHSCIMTGPVDYMESIFTQMMTDGMPISADPRLLALEYYAPMFLLISSSDYLDKGQSLALLKEHIDRFIIEHT